MQNVTSPGERPRGYPSSLERGLRLRNGRSILIRPVLPSDAPALLSAVDSADPETLHRRFFTVRPRLSAAVVEYLVSVDYRKRLAVVALDGSKPIAIARYESIADSDEAEVAVVVAPEWRRLGVARALAETLRCEAEANGIKRVIAYCLATNGEAAALLASYGFDAGETEHGIMTARFSLDEQ